MKQDVTGPADGRAITSDEGLRARLLGRQAERESSARTYARHLPVVPVHAQGALVTGMDGRTYIDCLSGAGTLALGHNYPAVVDVLRATLERRAPLHVLDMITPEKDAFTSELLGVLPGDLGGSARVHFCGPTGADAVEAALKLARLATGRQGVVAFSGAYHGMTMGASAVSGGDRMRMLAGAGSAEVSRLPFPYDYRCPFGVGGGETARLSVQLLENLLDDPASGLALPAAVIVEVVQGEGGVIPASDNWLREVRRITEERGIVLILDEVQTGVGRTGTFWACQRADVVPDILVMSKAVGGGLPLALIAYRPELDVWLPGDHTGTFRGNTLAMVAGEVTLRTVREERLDQRAVTVGARLAEGLEQLVAAHGFLGQARGRGLMLGVEVVDPHGSPDRLGVLPPAPARAQALRSACVDTGLLLELGGRHDTVLRLLPPLILSDAQADQILERLSVAFTRCASWNGHEER
ncbi:diaminobutyrate--2-oxoglutarate transaminase family protein [Streptomyces sp. NPDC007205]|uniref:diaminobutyrate--2-oxoglutarate transaminase family protein n=1 Tax=Streptomyces sp. NPDC007205 TaxID=3154316 RepID=UPI00340A8EDC